MTSKHEISYARMPGKEKNSLENRLRSGIHLTYKQSTNHQQDVQDERKTSHEIDIQIAVKTENTKNDSRIARSWNAYTGRFRRVFSYTKHEKFGAKWNCSRNGNLCAFVCFISVVVVVCVHICCSCICIFWNVSVFVVSFLFCCSTPCLAPNLKSGSHLASSKWAENRENELV